MKKGFTLIELLVVISIIGLLASVALASLNSARAKAADANIKQNLSGIRAQAELYYDNNGESFGVDYSLEECALAENAFFVLDPTVQSAIAQAQALGGYAFEQQGFSTTHSICGLLGNEWVVMIPLRSAPDGVWCVDSLGNSMTLLASEIYISPDYQNGELYSCVLGL